LKTEDETQSIETVTEHHVTDRDIPPCIYIVVLDIKRDVIVHHFTDNRHHMHLQIVVQNGRIVSHEIYS